MLDRVRSKGREGTGRESGRACLSFQPNGRDDARADRGRRLGTADDGMRTYEIRPESVRTVQIAITSAALLDVVWPAPSPVLSPVCKICYFSMQILEMQETPLPMQKSRLRARGQCLALRQPAPCQ
jgi:hypothetical protein